ncbi:hypothetical protein [Streptomyces sp. MBT33]|nr:hypothetical protein [Streptomyces sp. MBT33]MBK3645739.1 hypothetical protein [Streptomyces sp. MBT33]
MTGSITAPSPRGHCAAWRFAETANASYLSHFPTSATTTIPDRAGEETRG